MTAETARTASRRTLGGAWPLIRVVTAVQFVCAVIFGVDIAYELHNDLLEGQPLSPWQISHLVIETLAVGLLLVGFSLSGHEMLRLRQEADGQADTLAFLRGHFDDILVSKFAAWGLTKAESDIALLSLRGLKISEIAVLRKTKEGTIKAQLSAIFHKAGIGTRTELLGLFMDEFLDFGATQDESGRKPYRSADAS